MDSSHRNKENNLDTPDIQSRRDFLIGLKKWSKAVIGGVLLAGSSLGADKEARAWGVRRRVVWANRRGPRAWLNGGRAWANGGRAWINR